MSVVYQQRPPEHVCSAFGVPIEQLIPVRHGSGTGFAAAGIVVSTAVDHSLCNWSARARETLNIDGLDVARPVRSSDGRYVVGGWRADSFTPGRPILAADVAISLTKRIASALETVERPRVVQRRYSRPWSEIDVFAASEAAAWDGSPEIDLAPGMEDLVPPFATHRAEALIGAGALLRLRVPVENTSAIVHGNLLRSLHRQDGGGWILTDVVPYYRPVAWSAAVVAVDALALGDGDDRIVERWAHLPQWPQMLLRAAAFRLSIHAIHPQSRAGALPGLRRATESVENWVQRQ